MSALFALRSGVQAATRTRPFQRTGVELHVILISPSYRRRGCLILNQPILSFGGVKDH